VLNRISIVSILAFLAVIACHVGVAEAQFVKDGLVSWWSFNRSSIGDDGTVRDEFGGNDAIIEGGVEITEGVAGECLEFDGTSGYVEIPHNESLDMAQSDLSLEAWVKASTQPGGLWLNTIFAKGGTNWNAGYLIAVRGDSDATFVGGLTTLVSAAGGGTETHTEKNIDDNGWHHVVGVFSRSSGEIRGYIDGKLEQSTGADANLNIGTEAEARLGRSSQQSASADWYAGLIDEVRVYNKALSNDEVKQNFDKGATAVFPAEKLSVTWGRIKVAAQ
jgi:hypothetical protein